MAMSALDAAIKVGEQATARAIFLANRERKFRWKMYRVRAMVRRFENVYALELIEEMLEALDMGVNDMRHGPPITWVHALHQVTGLFALRGTKMTESERETVKIILRDVLAEMEDDRNWGDRATTGSTS
jgi:uncharacterized protein YbjT (DUF2867 family)